MHLLPTTLVGSYAQPEWLIDRARLGERFPPRVRARELWRVAPEHLEEAWDDATRLAIDDQVRAGVDIVTDGEQRRESYSNRFATALEGLDLDHPGEALDRSGHPNPVPRVVGPIRRTRPVQLRDLEVLRRHAPGKVKLTVPGPFTLGQQAQDDFYGDPRKLALDYAAAVNAEVTDLLAAGADYVQLDEPYLQARPEAARAYGVEVLNRALEGTDPARTLVHICFGYAKVIHGRPEEGYAFLPELAACRAGAISVETAQSHLDTAVLEQLPGKTILLGVLDLSTEEVETPATVAERIRRGLAHVPAERIVVAPDCGLKYLSRQASFGKLKAMVAGAALVRAELG